jgi:hypothetical protein
MEPYGPRASTFELDKIALSRIVTATTKRFMDRPPWTGRAYGKLQPESNGGVGVLVRDVRPRQRRYPLAAVPLDVTQHCVRMSPNSDDASDIGRKAERQWVWTGAGINEDVPPVQLQLPRHDTEEIRRIRRTEFLAKAERWWQSGLSAADKTRRRSRQPVLITVSSTRAVPAGSRGYRPLHPNKKKDRWRGAIGPSVLRLSEQGGEEHLHRDVGMIPGNENHRRIPHAEIKMIGLPGRVS